MIELVSEFDPSKVRESLSRSTDWTIKRLYLANQHLIEFYRESSGVSYRLFSLYHSPIFFLEFEEISKGTLQNDFIEPFVWSISQKSITYPQYDIDSWKIKEIRINRTGINFEEPKESYFQRFKKWILS